MTEQEGLKRISEIVEMTSDQRDRVFGVLASIHFTAWSKGHEHEDKDDKKDTFNYLRNRTDSEEWLEYLRNHPKLF